MKITYSDPAKSGTFGKKIRVMVVLDRSGSMNTIRKSTVDGYNEYLGSLRADPNAEYFVSLVQFDSDSGNETELTVNYEDRKLAKVSALELKDFAPRGGTPLYDAIGACINRTDKNAGDVQSHEIRNAPVIMVIITDGQENSSKEFTKLAVKSLITAKEKAGWTFVFLGTGIDSYSESRSIGMSVNSTSNFNAVNTVDMYKGLGTATLRRSLSYQSMGASANTMSFFADDERSNMGDTTSGLSGSAVDLATVIFTPTVTNATYGGSALLTPEDVAARLQVNVRTVYNQLDSGEIKGVKVGRQWRINSADLP